MDQCVILIGGDLCPTPRNYDLFDVSNTEALFGKLQQDFHHADFNIINLECPIIADKKPVEKIGPVLGTNKSCISVLKQLKINCVCLANNHIFDHGADGLRNTMRELSKNNISFVGAGRNLKEASKILTINLKNIKIGILAMSEHEFYTATDVVSGTNPLDIMHIVTILKENKNKFNYKIALIHGGVEHFQYPTPRMQRVSRFLIEQGINCIVWQHSHCPGYIEKYQNGYIIYGQGNLLFDIGKQKNLLWHQGYLVKLLINNRSSKIELVPYLQSFNSKGIDKLDITAAREFSMNMFSRISLFRDLNYVKKIWDKYCLEKRSWYLGEITGYARIINRFNISTSSRPNHFLFKLFNINKELLLKYRNLLICESHFDVIANSIDLYLKEKIKKQIKRSDQ